ncbi:MAG: DNA mismatch repair protein MutS [Methanothrix sp.]|nr:DNA mismatch repair protein MutS [Methanothrix sp.]
MALHLRLKDLPGVGPKLRERLIEQYGDEQKAIEAILAGDLSGLTLALSERQALLLVQHGRCLRHSISPDQFLATEEAARVQEKLIELLSGYAHTDFARQKIMTLFASGCLQIIEENRSLALAAAAAAKNMMGRGLEELIQRVRPLREKTPTRVRERALAATTVECFSALKARGLERLIDLHLAESPSELLDLTRSYSHVCLADGREGLAEVERAECLEDWYLVPEAVLGYYKENLESLLAAARAAELLRDGGIAGFSDWGALEGLLFRLEEVGDVEEDRLKRLGDNIAPAVERAEAWANEELRQRIEKSSLTLGGSDLLLAMRAGDGVRELLQAQMRGIFKEVVKQALARAAAELELAGSESVRLEEIFPSEAAYPLEIDRQALHSFQQEVRSRREERGIKARRDLARLLQDQKKAALELVHALMEFDFLYALGCFIVERDLAFAQFVPRPCLSFNGGRHLFLDDPEPVSYALGDSEHPETVSLLSGVNSGGKTTLLDLIAQIMILAHMGLPVPASSCRLSLVEEFYYFSKSRGTLSAGAFETAMRKFAIVENEKRKLVIADELESITEPGASARIISCILDELNRRGSLAVFVSHLAGEVLRYAETAVRVDGIEAEGLDEKSNLRLCRSPRYNFLARSTPELILDRLVRTAKGSERHFFERLLSKFR